MAFDTGEEVKIIGVQAPDFSANLSKYNDRVVELGRQIKMAQAQLEGIQQQIDQDRVNQQTQRDISLAKLNQDIADIQNQINFLTSQRDSLLVDINTRQVQRDSIALDFSNKQKALDDSWTDFHTQVDIYLVQAAQLKKDQEALVLATGQLSDKQSVFEADYQAKTDSLNQQSLDLDRRTAVLAAQKRALDDQQTLIETSASALEQSKADLATQLLSAQSILDQADVVSKQKIQNDIDQKKNSADALRNQTDANQIKAARIAVNQQQQEINSRMATLTAAEAALKTGG